MSSFAASMCPIRPQDRAALRSITLIYAGACIERCRDRRDIALFGGVVNGGGMRYNRNVYKQ